MRAFRPEAEDVERAKLAMPRLKVGAASPKGELERDRRERGLERSQGGFNPLDERSLCPETILVARRAKNQAGEAGRARFLARVTSRPKFVAVIPSRRRT